MTVQSIELRAHPHDRRAPVPVAAGQCPMGRLCGCCPGPEGRGHFRPGEDGKPGRQINDCRLTHPAADRNCRLPYPKDIPACPEREVLPQGSPPGRPPAGASCIDCGRMTARRWSDPDGRPLPWCGGRYPHEIDTRATPAEEALDA